MNDERECLVESGRSITESSGHFAPRVYNAAAADPVMAYLKSSTGATHYFIQQPIPIDQLPAESSKTPG